LLGAPQLFGTEIGFNLPAFVIALVITAILVIGIKGERAVQCHHRGGQGVGGAVRIALGAMYVHPGNWGHSWSSVRGPWDSPNRRGGRVHFLRLHRVRRGLDHRAGKPRIRSAICRSGSSPRCSSARSFYIAVAAILTGMVPWQNVNIEAPSRGHLWTGAECGRRRDYTGRGWPDLLSVMLVMLLGTNARAVTPWRTTACCPGNSSPTFHPKFRTPWKNTILVGLLAAVVGSVTPSTISERW